MLSIELVSEFVQEYFAKVKVTKGGTHFLARCTLCGDSAKNPRKKRFNLDWNNGRPIWHCFNCSRSGSFLDLYAELKGISRKHAYKLLYAYDTTKFDSETGSHWKNGEVKAIEVETIRYFNEIKNECIGTNEKTDSYVLQKFQNYLLEFLKDRKIPKDIPLLIAHKGRYKGRIIIPIYDSEGNVLYFQGRAVNDYITPKYLNPISEKEHIIHNKDNFDSNKTIVVTEGLIDAIMIPDQGTACLGSSVSDDFVKKLLELTNMGVVLAFDNDKPGIESALKFMKESRYNNTVKYFMFPDKYIRVNDLNALASQYGITDIYSFVLGNSHFRQLAEVKMKFRRKLL
jgi:hypothetical protein